MNFFEEIESYLNNELSPTDRQTFESEMAKNADLYRAVAEQRQLLTWFEEDKNQFVNKKQDAERDVSMLDLENYFLEELAKLPDAPVETLEKDENVIARHEATEGVKIVPLNPSPVKKTKVWWPLAASFALVVAAGAWWFSRSKIPQPTVAQTPIVVPPVDTVTKNGVPTVEKPLVIQPKGTPQYSTEKKEIAKQNKEQKALEIPKTPIETPQNNDAVLAVLENVASKEYEQITEPTKGASSNVVSKEDQTLLKALEAISANKPTVALDVLLGRNDEKARYYRALATLLMDKKKGKQALEALANDTDLEVYFRNKIKDLLKKVIPQ